MSELPEILFDGYAVYQALDIKAKQRTSPENVSDTLDAIVRIMRDYKNTRADSSLVERIENLLIEIDSGFIECWDDVEGSLVEDGIEAALKVVSERLRPIIDEHKEGCREGGI